MRNNFIAIFVCLLIVSCNNDSEIYTVGEDFIDLNTNVVFIDTLTVNASTVISDSIVTSGTNRILIGSLNDPELGNLTSQSFLKLITSNYDIDSDAVYDSIGLILHYDKYYKGDTTKIQTYKVYEIIEEFEPKDDDQISFYNTSTLNYSTTSLGELSFTPFPNKKDSIYIPITNNLGEKLFNNIKNDEVTTSYELNQIFKGITIVSNTNSEVVLGFNFNTSFTPESNSVIRLYYTIKDDEFEESNYYLDFSIENTGYFFNKITNNKSNTLLSTISSMEDILPSTVTNNKAYIQSGTGINMRVEIPYLKTLNALENKGTSLMANLKMFPVNNSYDIASNIETLNVYIVDHKNRFISELLDVNGSQVIAQLTTEDNEFEDNSYYTVNLSSFINDELVSTYNNNYALLFQFPTNNNSVDKVAIYNDFTQESKMKLELIYLKY
jgi:hypothetical protein